MNTKHAHPIAINIVLILVLLLVLLFFVVDAGSATGNTFYVALTGNDNNAGTQAQPWRTIQKAANSVTAGDTVIVLSGTYPKTRVTISASGTDSAPIVFQGNGLVEMAGFIVSGNHIQIKGFTIKVISCETANYGIEILGDNFVIEKNNFLETVDAGVYTSHATANGLIRDNYFYHNVQSSIQLHGQNHIVEKNEIKRPIQRHPTCSLNTDDANGVLVFGSGHIFRDNYIHEVWHSKYTSDAHMDCFQTYAGWQSGDPLRNTNIIFERNYCDALTYTSGQEATAGVGFTIEEVDSNNNSYEQGVIIRNNLILAAVCVGVYENSAWLSYVNNTCIATTEMGQNNYGMDYWPGTSFDNHHYKIQNNIFYNFNVPIYVTSQVWNGGTVTSSNNLAYNGGLTIPVSTAFKCNQNNNICANPMFVNMTADLLLGDYHLSSNSPALNAGFSLTDVTDDFEGNSRPDGGVWDLGAYEFQNVPQAPSANFSANPSSGDEPLMVQFNDLSVGSPTSWSWDFGDGTTSSVQNPSHQYLSTGYYTVSFIAENALDQDMETKFNYIVVRPSGTPDVIFSDGFESSLSWTTVGNVNWYTGSPKLDTHGVQLLKTGSVEKNISTAGYEFVTVTFYLGANSLDTSSENIQALWYDGATWTVLKQISNGDPEENNQLNYFEFQLPASADNNANLAFQFKIIGSGTGDFGYVDNVVVEGFPFDSTSTPTSTVTSIPPTLTNTAVPPTLTSTAISIPPTATYTAIPPTPTSTPGTSSQRIFLDDFETAFNGWNPTKSIIWYTGSPKNGTHSIRMAGNEAWMRKTISTEGYHNIIVRAYLGAYSFEASEAFKLFWWNGSSWVKLKVISNGSPEEDTRLHFLEFSLPSTADNKSTFKLAFNLQSSDLSDYAYIDDVEVWGTP